MNVEPDGRRVVDMLTSSQLDEKRKGFKLCEDRCWFVNNAFQSIGECADYNTEEKEVVGGILADYFITFQMVTSKLRQKGLLKHLIPG